MDPAVFSSASVDIDQHFGYQVKQIEEKLYRAAKILRPEGDLNNLGQALHQGHQTWIGLDPQTLQTPYSELVQICELLDPKPQDLMVDLGAGYGRLGLVLHLLYPGVFFKGFELVAERVIEGNRVFNKFNCSNAILFHQNLTSKEMKVPLAKYYFIYDYGTTADIRGTLKQLEELTSYHHFQIIARGKGTRSIIEHEHPWLCTLNPVKHFENFSIYSF